MRPGLVGVHQRCDAIDAAIAELKHERDEVRVGGVWRGGADGRALDSRGIEMPALTRKYREELNYWLSAARGGDPAFAPRESGGHGTLHEQFAGWAGRRLKELADQLSLDSPQFRDWCSQRVAVEIGCGPHPSVCEAEFRIALAVDPLCDAYSRERIAAERQGVVYLPGVGEQLPIASAAADIVIIENCLDHADEPRRVMSEIARVLKPGGLLWLLVDLMDYRDHMHPSPMNEAILRSLLAEKGLEIAYLASWPPGSHLKAEKQCRVLAKAREES